MDILFDCHRNQGNFCNREIPLYVSSSVQEYLEKNMATQVRIFIKEQRLKKALFLIGIILSISVASCTIFSLQIRPTGFIAQAESERKTGLVTISVQTAWENGGPGNKPGNGNSQGNNGHDRITGFSVVFRNTTNSPVLIVWGKSSLKYNGGAFMPFIEGQKYEDFSRPMNATVIPPMGTVRKNIFSSQQPYSDSGKHGGWKMRPIMADNVVLVFCVQSRGIEDYYTIAIR